MIIMLNGQGHDNTQGVRDINDYVIKVLYDEAPKLAVLTAAYVVYK